MVKDYEKGGVRALDLESVVGTFKINWLRACLSQSDSIWFHIPRSLFKELEGIYFLLRCDFEISKIPSFHKQILSFWKMMFTHNFSPHTYGTYVDPMDLTKSHCLSGTGLRVVSCL